MLTQFQQAKLNKINAELKKYGVLPITESLSKSQIEDLKAETESVKMEIMESTAFNKYHENPDYACAILVQEAIEILINPKDDSPIVRYVAEDTKTKLSEMRSMYAQYVEKHGETTKAKALKQKITEAEAKLYESATAEKMKTILRESAGKAQTIMSAKGLQDDMIDFQAKVGDIQNKYVDSFIAMVNEEYGADVAFDIQNRLMNSLDDLMKMVRKTKNDMLEIVNILSGNESSRSDDMVQPETSDESMSDFEDEVVDTETDSVEEPEVVRPDETGSDDGIGDDAFVRKGE